MKIQIEKIDAAERQLVVAIKLFFQREDPVAIHTLLGASVQILHDYIDIWKTKEKRSAYEILKKSIAPEYVKEFFKQYNKARNFFKHGDRDFQKGQRVLEFDTDLNYLLILDGITALQEISKDKLPIEILIFHLWLISNQPELYAKETRQQIEAQMRRLPDSGAPTNVLRSLEVCSMDLACIKDMPEERFQGLFGARYRR